MAWRTPYGREHDDTYADWRKSEVERVVAYQKARLARFRERCKALFAERVPASVTEARSMLHALGTGGYPLKGDVWLARHLAAIGIVVQMPKRSTAGLKLAQKDDALLSRWAVDCLMRDATGNYEPTSLDELCRSTWDWAKNNGCTDRIGPIGPRKLAAWLRREGWAASRRSFGIVFPGMLCKRKKQ